MRRLAVLTLLVVAVPVTAEPNAAERGEKALTTTAFIPAFWTPRAVDSAWKQWGVAAKPADYDAALRDRYGLHPAPYPNDGLPMGLRKARHLFGTGVGADCMMCHGGSVMGTSYVGLGNASLDIQGLFEDLARADGIAKTLPFTFSQVRGTNEADGFGVYLLGFRNPDLSMKPSWTNLGLRDDTCADVPAWWLLKKKRTMYATGATDSRSVRSLMQFMMHPLNGPADFTKHELAFRDVQAYLLSLTPPKYPFPIDAAKADAGRAVFAEHCARCHGTYGATPTYPNRIVPLAEIGTDPVRHRSVNEAYAAAYTASWFGKEPAGWFVDGKLLRWTPGYQAPPLDGVWATAPYLHNGSVPTLAGVLNSKARPNLFTRSFRTGVDDYDRDQVGWKVTELAAPPGADVPPVERRKVYDTTRSGRSNAGHTFGDDLTDAERRAVIEYLKTL
ncbi:c-type cytochrome [Urbifossiella limnaea]|uniref:Cytochrome c n=1 Tax=Urbifossiella limnaea TaxID=2528023 RepID=A0A517XRA1_9BACT|nr:cytochrome c [Urbifossiella limnaea]QDU20048.1 Cytochrome c [Urbifossiella limnaea]